MELPSESTRPDKRLAGRVALITGAGSVGDGFGTGKATAVALAREGAQVVLVDSDLDRARVTQMQIESFGGQALSVEGDITSSTDARAMVEAALGRFGQLHILVNNIGISARGTVEELAEEVWDRTLNVNLKGMFLVSKFSIPAIRNSGGGAIVNISSIGASFPNISTPLTAYTASKGGVEALTRAMAVDHGKDGIRVNCVAPGPIFTPRQIARWTDPTTREKRKELSLMNAEGTAWDIAWAVTFLVSDEAKYISGVTLPVDGGISIKGHAYR